MSTILDVTELDFDQIKSTLQGYFTREDSPFKDWNFSGSGLNMLLDVLAYNTHYNALLAHLAANESFLSSARLRKNVVARATTLGYLPRSASASSTTISLDGADITSLSQIPRGTVFNTTIGDDEYSFIVPDNTTGDFTSESVTAYQGSLKTVRFEYDKSVRRPKFQIPDKNIDIDHLIVQISAQNSSVVTAYTKFTELSEITATSNVYFISENPDGYYEIEFGDDILGSEPNNLDIITLSYIVTDGKSANGAATFTLGSTLRDSNGVALDITVDSATISANGADRENIESIRRNAPLLFTAQDRAVTASDYKAIIKNVSSAEFVAVWGGEDNVPQTNGTVYICAKTSSTPGNISSTEKSAILDILDNKGVLTLNHVFVDPAIIYLYFDIWVKYDPTLTSLSASAIATNIRNAVSQFETDNLQDFSSIFRHSQFLRVIDTSDPAILNSVARIMAYKDYSRSIDDTGAASIDFTMKLDEDFGLVTEPFTLGSTQEFYIGPVPGSLTANNEQTLRRYYLDPKGKPVDVDETAGVINYFTGEVTIDADQFGGSATNIRFIAKPASDNVAAKRHNIISIDTSKCSFTATEDRVALLGHHAADKYETIDRE